MKSTLCCVAAFTLGWLITETPGVAGVWAGVLGGLLLPVIMLWPMWLIINWLIPPLKLEDE